MRFETFDLCRSCGLRTCSLRSSRHEFKGRANITLQREEVESKGAEDRPSQRRRGSLRFLARGEPSRVTGAWNPKTWVPFFPRCWVYSKDSLRVSYIKGQPFKTKHPFTMTTSTLLGIYFKQSNVYVHTKTCVQISRVALFIIAQTRKQPRCPLLGEWINKLWAAMEILFVMKRNELSRHQKTRRSPKCILLRERSPLEKAACGMIPTE